MVTTLQLRIDSAPTARATLLPTTREPAVSIALAGGQQRAVALMSILSARALIRELGRAIRDAERMSDYA